jgi:hypothetical protein
MHPAVKCEIIKPSMTATEFVRLFDIIADKVGSDYFTPAEKADFINRAQYSVIDTLLFPQRRNQEKKDKDSFEFAYQNSMVQGLSKLHVTLDVQISNPSSISFSDIASVLLADFGVASQPYKIINVLLPNDVAQAFPEWSAKFVASNTGSNSIYKNLRFGKNTDVRYATYTIEQALANANEKSIVWSVPILVNDAIRVELIRTPVPFTTSGGGQTCEVDPIYHNEILFRALQLAGISIREADFYEMTTIEQSKEA